MDRVLICVSDLIQEWHDSNEGLDEDVAWRCEITQALDLTLHDVMTYR